MNSWDNVWPSLISFPYSSPSTHPHDSRRLTFIPTLHVKARLPLKVEMNVWISRYPRVHCYAENVAYKMKQAVRLNVQSRMTNLHSSLGSIGSKVGERRARHTHTSVFRIFNQVVGITGTPMGSHASHAASNPHHWIGAALWRDHLANVYFPSPLFLSPFRSTTSQALSPFHPLICLFYTYPLFLCVCIRIPILDRESWALSDFHELLAWPSSLRSRVYISLPSFMFLYIYLRDIEMWWWRA